MQLKGYLLAALAAALYGTNPAFAVPLYSLGMNPLSVVLFRYLLGIPLLGACVFLEGEGFGLRKNEIIPVIALGLVMAASSLTLYESYHYMNPGVASTLLFMFPILTALIMTIFFHEKFRLMTAICLLIMSAGLYFLMISPDGVSLDLTGIIMISVSSLTYAVYLVMLKVSSTLKLVPTLKSLFYQLLAGAAFFVLILSVYGNFVMPAGLTSWLDVCSLALFPTVLSLICTMKAINYIGPTPTAILGALEPVTAVILSIIILGEPMTLRELCGGILIIIATMLVVLTGEDEHKSRQGPDSSIH